MANRYAMHIRIGGLVASAALSDLLSATVADGVADDWGGGPVADTADDLRHVIAGLGGEPLCLYDVEHTGCFDALERFCIDNGLVFVAHSSAGAEADAELRWWKPGMEGVRSCSALEDGSPVLAVAALVAMLAESSARGLRRRVAALVDQATPPGLPPLRVAGEAPRLPRT